MKKTLSSLVCVFALFAASQSFAHEGHGGMDHGVCADDMKKLCGDVKKDDHPAMMKCMKDNEDKLSDPCKTMHTKMKARMDAFMAVCKSDMEKLCKDVPKDDHKAMHDCMMKNEANLTGSCKTEHDKMKKWHHEHEKMEGKGKKEDKKSSD